MLRDKNHKSILMRPLEKAFGLPSPYNLVEGLGCMQREQHGPDRKHGVRVPYLPHDSVINEGVTPEFRLGFVGDILDTKGMPAEIAPDIRAFFSDCDALLGNFESIITDLPGHGTSVRHIPAMMDTLAALFPPENTYLSIANNHAGDYPTAVLFNSIRQLEQRGFNVFGWDEKPYIDITSTLRVIGATDWSNAACEHVAMLEKRTTPTYRKAQAFNLLYPHWGYELELYPRRSMLRKAARWNRYGFDAILAHHGHTPRAIFSIPQLDTGLKSLVADSLGDFVCGFEPVWYNYGIIGKLTLGRDAQGRFAAGSLAWRFCRTRPENGTVRTELCDEPEY